jgi:hypothetical protein
VGEAWPLAGALGRTLPRGWRKGPSGSCKAAGVLVSWVARTVSCPGGHASSPITPHAPCDIQETADAHKTPRFVPAYGLPVCGSRCSSCRPPPAAAPRPHTRGGAGNAPGAPTARECRTLALSEHDGRSRTRVSPPAPHAGLQLRASSQARFSPYELRSVRASSSMAV